ncbi:MAG: DUF2079 domain-containing protein, partial [Aeromicrobium sp.]
EQALRSYARPGAPIVDIKAPGFNLLGDHFHPILVLLAPVYRVFPAAETLLIAQAALFAISVVVIGRLAVAHAGGWAGGALTVSYGLSFGLASAVASDFHEIAFGVPLLAFAGAAYVARRFDRVVWWSLPLLLVKEDLGLTVAVIGAVLWWAGDRRRGVLLAASGLVGTAFAVLIFLPAFNPGGVYDYASSVGGDRGSFATLVDEPGRKLLTVVVTFGVTGLAALLSPWALLVLPTFGWRFVGDNAYYWGTDWHYSALLMPIVFVAAIDAMRRRPVLRWAAVPAVVTTAVMVVGSPLADLVDGETYRDAPRAAAAREAVSRVPDGASVETDIALMSHLTSDHEVYWLGTIGNVTGDRAPVEPDYVLFDVDAGIGSPTDVVAYAEQTHGGTYTEIFNQDGYVLAHRRP